MIITKGMILVLFLSPALLKADDCVVLLNGLARSCTSMDKLTTSLRKEGCKVVNFDYPPPRFPIEQLAEEAISAAILHCPSGGKVHFFAHSLGGVLVRQYLRECIIENLGLVVMLGPPNQGSEEVDPLRDVPGFKLINGLASMRKYSEAFGASPL